ncbi:MAG: hypothetical protein ABEJ76_01525 [Halanaeroarchaeum sp.]
MNRWRDRVDELLFAGEEVLVRVGRGPDEVVVTTHRLLALSPAGDGPNFRAVDRPNVTDVGFEATGRPGLLVTGLQVGVVGIVLAAAGLLVDFGGMFGSVQVDSGTAIGAGGVLEMLELFRAVAALANEVLLLVGGALVFGALLAAGAFLSTRSGDLVIDVAGEEPVHLDADAFGQSDLGTIRSALEGRTVD